MARRKSLRDVANEARPLPLVSPNAHDALSARMIERMGFKALALGGSTMLAARYGLPDLGLAALAEMAETTRDIVGATDLPCLVDGDDGYGDVKSVVRMIRIYDEMGVGGVLIEDQNRDVKQAGYSSARGIADVASMSQKLRAAAQTRSSPDMLVIARCDAYGLEGLEGTFRRCDAYLRAGADGIFIPGIPTVDELARIGGHFAGAYKVADMVENRQTWLKPSELGQMGFDQIVYPNFVMLRTMAAANEALAELHRSATSDSLPAPSPGFDQARALFRDLVREPEWAALEKSFG